MYNRKKFFKNKFSFMELYFSMIIHTNVIQLRIINSYENLQIAACTI